VLWACAEKDALEHQMLSEFNGRQNEDGNDLMKLPSQLQVFLLPTNFELEEMTSHKHSLAASTASKWRPLRLLSTQH